MSEASASPSSSSSPAAIREVAKLLAVVCYHRYEQGKWDASRWNGQKPSILELCELLGKPGSSRLEGLKTDQLIFDEITTEAGDLSDLTNPPEFPILLPGKAAKELPRKLSFIQRRKCMNSRKAVWDYLLGEALKQLKSISKKKKLSFARLFNCVVGYWHSVEIVRLAARAANAVIDSINSPSVEQDDPRVVERQLAIVDNAV